ncbi:hypothetical protein D3C72_1815010 [compost metagenome]
MTQTKFRQDSVQNAAVQCIDAHPSQGAVAYLLHGGPVAFAPRQGKGIAIDLWITLCHLSQDGAVPVHHRAEHIERQHLGNRENCSFHRHSLQKKSMDTACSKRKHRPIALVSGRLRTSIAHKKSAMSMTSRLVTQLFQPMEWLTYWQIHFIAFVHFLLNRVEYCCF